MKAFLLFLFIVFNFSFASDFLYNFQKIVSNSKGFEARITQKTYQAGFKNPDVFVAEVKATKPLTVKIDYQKPYQQTIFMNKEKIVLYNKEENQAVITSPQNSLLITDVISIFVENKPIDRIFSVSTLKESDKYVVLDLKPKTQDDVKSIQITLEKVTYIPKSITALDNDGNKIEITFENFKYYNTALNIDFKLPKNTEIIKQ
ncbi:MAG: outer membrane lipoprotein carrier protein LolA [Sulfurihydrogenibium sp.]|nr:MAG: outer membrane lipoprotein carrier protein LolA [Sulfurihydrogenibium sp.]PMP77828.1 MAG: outer membrane lipoprotein carrier protein LolA [Sulfurihydrogenibium sp.]